MSNRERFYAGELFRLKMFDNIYKFSFDNVAQCEQILVKTKPRTWQYYATIDPISIHEFTVFYLFFNELFSKKIRFEQLIFANEKGAPQS